MKKSLLALATLAICSSAMAQADNKYYGEIGYGALKYKEDGYSVTPSVVGIKLGMNFDKNFSGELFAATNASSDSITYSGVNINVKYDSAYGVYLKGKTELAKDFEVFARVGVLHAKIKAEALGQSISDTGTDFSYGVGAQYNFTKTVYGSVDYMSYYRKDGATVTGPTLSLGVKF